jgi:hypothetical protein
MKIPLLLFVRYLGTTGGIDGEVVLEVVNNRKVRDNLKEFV